MGIELTLRNFIRSHWSPSDSRNCLSCNKELRELLRFLLIFGLSSLLSATLGDGVFSVGSLWPSWFWELELFAFSRRALFDEGSMHSFVCAVSGSCGFFLSMLKALEERDCTRLSYLCVNTTEITHRFRNFSPFTCKWMCSTFTLMIITIITRDDLINKIKILFFWKRFFTECIIRWKSMSNALLF